MNPEQRGGAAPAKVGPYLLEGQIGAGGMGSVWRAWDERLRRPVAIKRILPERLGHPGARHRFRREAAAGARLNHPAVVHVYDILETEDGEWIVMELVEGRTLADLLNAGPLELARAVRLGREIAKGLGKAHAQGIIHRDLKAANVMVTPSGHAKILDFGIAKLLHWDSQDGLSRPDAMVGTPHAMSPEQMLGLPVGPRSDLFSFGSLLYEVLTGISPFRADSVMVTISRVCSHRQPPVRQLQPEVPPELSELVDWLLEKEPQHRPENAREVAAVLNAILTRLVRERTGEERPAVAFRSRSAPAAPAALADDTLDATFPQILPLAAGERRQVTVICCGLVTEDAGGWRSPSLEELAAALPELRSLAGEVVARFGGQLGVAPGPLLWIYFGVPEAHGDDAQRAVCVAWELLAGVERSGWARQGDRRLALRAGIHSGLAVVSKIPRTEPAPLGPTRDLATAIQSLAPGGGVLVSGATHRLTARGFGMEELPPARLTGWQESVPVFRVRGGPDTSENASRPSVPLVGRDGELYLLLQRWILVQDGESQVVLISGEAGIGKSRLAQALREELSGDPVRWLTCYGAAHARSSPFQAVIDLLRRNWLRTAESPEGEMALLEALLRQYGLPDDDLPYLAGLLSLPSEGTAPLAASAETRRQRTLEALVNFFLQAVGEEPMVFVIEDLHWLDPSSLELVGALLDAIGGVSVLLILTLRPELALPWGHRAGWLQLHLNRLTDHDALDMINQVPGAHQLQPQVKQRIAAKSDGVPLYLEELTKSLLEADEEPEAAGIPGLLRDSLTARLDRLGRAKEVAQLAAVIGRSFSFELLAAVSSLGHVALLKELDRLVRAELLSRRGSGEQSTYMFRHALLQEAACQLLLPDDLRRLHHKVVTALESRFPEMVAGRPELLAHHYAQAGQPEKAIEHWLRAGRNAAQRYANLEASEHFRNGLRVAGALSAGPERDRLELALWIELAPTVIVSRGHSDAEAEALFDRALFLGQRLGDMPDGFHSLLWSFYAWRGDLQKARRIAAERLRAATARREPEGMILGLQEMATVKAHLSRPASALCALQRARDLLAGRGAACPLQISGWDAECYNLCQTARSLCETGYPDRALEVAGGALRRAEDIGCPFATSLALQSLGLIHLARREDPEALEAAGRMRGLSEQQGFASLAAHGAFLVSLATARLSPPEEAVLLVGEALQALDLLRREHRQELGLPELLGSLAEVCVRCAMTSEARWLLDDALEIAARTGERLGMAELHRLQAVLLLAELEGTPAPEVWRQVEGLFQAARAEARAGGSLRLELRAVAGLARLWSEDGRRDEARALLAGILERFQETSGTAELKEAAGLLERLSGPVP